MKGMLLGMCVGFALAEPAMAGTASMAAGRGAGGAADEEVDSLLSVLDPQTSTDESLRFVDAATAQKRLRGLGPRAAEALGDIVRDKNDPRRPLAGRQLGRLGGAAAGAVDVLLDTVADDDLQAAPLWAARTLAEIGPKALPAVRERLDALPLARVRGHDPRGRVVTALGVLGFLPAGALDEADALRLRGVIHAAREIELGGLESVAQAALIRHRAMQASDAAGEATPDMQELLDGWLNDLSEGMPAEANIAALALAILRPPMGKLEPTLESMWKRDTLEPERIACVAELIATYPAEDGVFSEMLASSLALGLSDARAAAAARVLIEPGRADRAMSVVFDSYAAARLGDEVLGARWRASHRVLSAAGRRAGIVADPLEGVVLQRRGGTVPLSVVPEFELFVSMGAKARPCLGRLMKAEDELVADLARHAAKMIADPDGTDGSLLDVSLAGARKKPRRR